MKNVTEVNGVPCNAEGVPYLTAESLGIHQWEHDCLIRVMNDFRSGVIKDENFDMNSIQSESSRCGTIACIGGWVALYKNIGPFEYVEKRKSPALHDLYYPPRQVFEDNTSPWFYNTIQAADRIEKFLLTGNPD